MVRIMELVEIPDPHELWEISARKVDREHLSEYLEGIVKEMEKAAKKGYSEVRIWYHSSGHRVNTPAIRILREKGFLVRLVDNGFYVIWDMLGEY